MKTPRKDRQDMSEERENEDAGGEPSGEEREQLAQEGRLQQTEEEEQEEGE
jgi:hypothetical protein